MHRNERLAIEVRIMPALPSPNSCRVFGFPVFVTIAFETNRTLVIAHRPQARGEENTFDDHRGESRHRAETPTGAFTSQVQRTLNEPTYDGHT